MLSDVRALPGSVRGLPRRPSRRGRPALRPLILEVGIPVGIRLVEMLAQLGMVALLNGGSGNALGDRFGIWDARLYAQIAGSGYPDHLAYASDGTLSEGTNLAFFPAFPLLARALHWLTGLSTGNAGILIAWICGCVFSLLVYRIARASGQGRAGSYLACALVGALPMAVVLQMGYAESLYAALLAGAILAALRGRWWVAGVVGSFAGASRPALPVLLAGLVAVAVVQSGGLGRSPALWRHWRRVAGACLLASLGTALYLGMVAIRTGRLDGWFEVQRAGWGTRFDGGASYLHFVSSNVRHPGGVPEAATVLITLGACVAVLTILSRRNLPYLAMAVVSLAATLMVTNYWHSKPRLLLAAPLIVVPLAGVLGRMRLNALPALIFGLAVSEWFGAYMITQWRFAI